jgi:RHS repeat-associated protein
VAVILGLADGSRLQTILHTNANGLILSLGYVYDVLGRITQMTETRTNSVSAWAYEYDLAGQLTAATQVDGNGAVLHRYVYAYDAAGNRTSEQIDTSVSTETANIVNQLTSRIGGGNVVVAGYLNKTGAVAIAGSPAMMITTTNFVGSIPASVGTNSFPVVANDFNGNATTNWYQLTVSANGLDTAINYDLAGNQITKSNSAGVLAFGWDGNDRCTAITNGALRTAIAYDGISRWSRITEYSNTTLTADRRFVWNGTTLAEERDASGSNVVQRFFANGFQHGGTNYFYVKDHLGSIRHVTDATGNIVASFSYDPYGRRTQTFGSVWVDFGFAGLFHHKASGTAWAVGRIDQPDVARWANRDPIKENGGLNLYAYCDGDPANRVDPLGFYAEVVVNGDTIEIVIPIEYQGGTPAVWSKFSKGISDAWTSRISSKTGKFGKYNVITTVKRIPSPDYGVKIAEKNVIQVKDGNLTSYCEPNLREGFWFADRPATTAAHEAGHLMGLEHDSEHDIMNKNEWPVTEKNIETLLKNENHVLHIAPIVLLRLQNVKP